MDYSSLPVFASADVVVCGGGAAGAFAAKSAADQGAEVLVVEQFGSLGGTATNGLTMPIMHTHIASNPQCSYVSKIVRDKLFAIGGCDESGANFDPFLLKIVLEEICVDAGVKLLFHTFIADVITENGKITAIVVANKKGLGLVKGKIFIDGTGDGDVCVRAGAGFTKGNPETGKNQPISLRYIVSNVNFEEFGAFINEEKKRTGVDGAASYYDGKIYVASALPEAGLSPTCSIKRLPPVISIRTTRHTGRASPLPAGRTPSRSTARSSSMRPTAPIQTCLQRLRCSAKSALFASLCSARSILKVSKRHISRISPQWSASAKAAI